MEAESGGLDFQSQLSMSELPFKWQRVAQTPATVGPF